MLILLINPMILLFNILVIMQTRLSEQRRAVVLKMYVDTGRTRLDFMRSQRLRFQDGQPEVSSQSLLGHSSFIDMWLLRKCPNAW